MTQSLNLLQGKVISVIAEGQGEITKIISKSQVPEFNLKMRIDGMHDSFVASQNATWKNSIKISEVEKNLYFIINNTNSLLFTKI